MKDVDCVRFLQWALPRNQMRWPGFRKVRGQVCKRITKRIEQLQLADTNAYQDYLVHQPHEWPQLDKLCRVTISRFYRDKLVFAQLAQQVLPALAARAQARENRLIHAWSVGCGSGEEPYSLVILWYHLLAAHFPAIQFSIMATDVDCHLLERCAHACYDASTVRNLPADMRSAAFIKTADQLCLKPRYKSAVTFAQQDIRETMPKQQFDLILCRNLVFTYFDEALQDKILHDLYKHLTPHGWLVLGVHEKLPADCHDFIVFSPRLGLYQKK